MDQTPAQGALERGVRADLWRNTLSRIPSLFERLVYLSNLRSPNSGRYEHHGLALVFSEAEADRELRKLHKEFFEDWLALTLEEQVALLRNFIGSLETTPRVTLETWTVLTPYRNLIPASVKPMARALYLAEMEVVVGVLKREAGVASKDLAS